MRTVDVKPVEPSDEGDDDDERTTIATEGVDDDIDETTTNDGREPEVDDGREPEADDGSENEFDPNVDIDGNNNSGEFDADDSVTNDIGRYVNFEVKLLKK